MVLRPGIYGYPERDVIHIQQVGGKGRPGFAGADSRLFALQTRLPNKIWPVPSRILATCLMMQRMLGSPVIVDPFEAYLSRSRDDYADLGPRAHSRSASRVVGRHRMESSAAGLQAGDEFSTSDDDWAKVLADFAKVLFRGHGRVMSALGAASPAFVARAAEFGVEVVGRKQ